MIFLGNGDRSGAACWQLASELVWLLLELGGLQQPLHSSTASEAAWMKECETRDRKKWEDRAEQFLYEVGSVLGYHVRLEKDA